MGLHSCDTRRRPSVTLDAGYVSITSSNTFQTSTIVGLHGKKLTCIISIILILVLISCINLTVSHFLLTRNKINTFFLVSCLAYV